MISKIYLNANIKKEKTYCKTEKLFKVLYVTLRVYMYSVSLRTHEVPLFAWGYI